MNFKHFPKFFVVLFVSAIALPMIESIYKEDQQTSLLEKRALVQWPNFNQAASLKDYFSQIGRYTNDHFGYRDKLITMNNSLKHWLGQSPSNKVVRGQGDWLFLKIRDPLLSQHSLTQKTITDNIQNRATYIRRMHSELSAKGVGYLFLVAPNKMTVYSEYLPSIYKLTDFNRSYKNFKSNFSTDLDYLIFSDDTLRTKKKLHTDTDLYFKNDTHWNLLGSYYVFEEFASRVKRLWPSIKLDAKQHEFTAYNHVAGDLAAYIGLNNQLQAIEPNTNFPECTDRSQHIRLSSDIVSFKCDANQTKVLIIGDSFMGYIYKYFAESSGVLYTVDQTASRERVLEIIDELKPDLVVEELVERHLPSKLP